MLGQINTMHESIQKMGATQAATMKQTNAEVTSLLDQVMKIPDLLDPVLKIPDPIMNRMDSLDASVQQSIEGLRTDHGWL